MWRHILPTQQSGPWRQGWLRRSHPEGVALMLGIFRLACAGHDELARSEFNVFQLGLVKRPLAAQKTSEGEIKGRLGYEASFFCLLG